MSDDSRWRSWLYETHSAVELHEWALRLHYFRFCRAFGGHANDGDQLRVALNAPTETELRNLFTVLGVPAHAIAPDTPDPKRGTAYTLAQYAVFPSRIDRVPTISQPGRVQIAGHNAFAWAHDGRLTFSLSDDDAPFDVTERTVDAALAIERRLLLVATEVLDPPLDNRHCICPKYYPAVWA
ncbi:hypothetical protein [Mycobacterium sp.]|uniref:hypothetical protein n=1 Tax=Mycobacterium sp. TaxID=1785 RepID=UPI002C7E15E7|nr:hypothetical protein [Mycobacterium sp.]HKP39617.1 hypothetical protein [Mycobacterium sp.]